MQAVLEPEEDTATVEPLLQGTESQQCPNRDEVRVLFPASARAILLNYLSAVSLLFLGYLFYKTHPWYQKYFPQFTVDALGHVLVAYLVLLPFYYSTFPDSYRVKCRLFWLALFHLPERLPTPAEMVALRAVLVKFFYLPLMINWMLFQVQGMQDGIQAFSASGRFLPDGYEALYRFIFVIDVVLFTIGYSVEHPWLKNEIRSVEPTLLGWVVALVCYPPLFMTSQQLFGWNTVDLPQFPIAWLQWPAALAMLILLSIYSWASVALCFKASNLTNRGIVAAGPYAFVRHPAYIAKNLAWWVGLTPFVITYSTVQPVAAFYAILGMACWSGIYCLRAITEERHLAVDPEYQEYCRQVRWRFIPGVI